MQVMRLGSSEACGSVLGPPRFRTLENAGSHHRSRSRSIGRKSYETNRAIPLSPGFSQPRGRAGALVRCWVDSALRLGDSDFQRMNGTGDDKAEEMTQKEIDQRAAIMIVIEHLGDVAPGTRCSAVFFDTEKLQKEKEFHAKLYRKNGVSDPATVREMVAANVADEPYWLVSLKSVDETRGETTRLHRVDARTGRVLDEAT